MKCARCQAENREGRRFCARCGASLAVACPACGFLNESGERFCGGCGAPTGAAPPETQQRFGTPLSYTPRYLADRILTARSSLEGERKQVTVLFCDLADSTPLSQRLGPEAMHELLDRFFELALAEVHRYEGTINQFLGDGFMALFGAPLAHEDHARRAVLASLGIAGALATPGRGLDDVRVRMGLNTGAVVVGKIGNNLRMDYTAVGDTTNLAARLQQFGEPGMIIVGPATWLLVRRFVRGEPLGPVTIKGVAEQVEAYRIVAAARRSTASEQRSRIFVGRERDLRALEDLFRLVDGGQGQVVGVVGDAGVGKSRLVEELQQTLGTAATWLEGRCVSYGASIPYLPIVDIIRTQCGIAEADTPKAAVEKVRVALTRAAVEVDDAVPYLLHLLGIKEGTEGVQALSPEAMKERTFETLRQVILRGSRRRPVAVVIEDLHWIDRSSEELLTTLAERLVGARVLLLGTYRPGHRPPWMDKSYATQLVLRPLPAADSRAIVSAVHGDLPDFVVERILDRAEGNPFFLEELTRVVGLHATGREEPVPETIQAVLAARIDRLPDAPKRLLQTAAVLGREFSPRLLARIWEDGDPKRHLAELTRHEFLYERDVGDETVYVFKHALTQDVAYASLLTPRRLSLHAAAGRALEALYADRLEEAYARLAHHYSRAEDASRAVDYLTRLADSAARIYAHAEAVAALEEARQHAELLPEDVRARRQVELALSEAESLHFLGRLREIVDLLQDERERLEALADPALAGRCLFRLGFTHSFLGNRDEAGANIMQGFAAAMQAGDERTMGRVKLVVGMERGWTGRLGEAAQLFTDAVELFARTGERWWLGWAYYGLSFVLTGAGEYAAAMDAAAAAEAVGESLGDRRIRSLALQMRGAVHSYLGEGEMAVELGERSVEMSPDLYETASHLGVLGVTHLENGNGPRAVEVLEQALELANRYRSRQAQAWYTAWLARAYALVGRIEEAGPLAERAIAAGQELNFAGGRAEGHRALGLAAQAREAWDEARAHLTMAREEFVTMGARGGTAQIEVDLGTLAGLRGDRDAALAHFRRAHTLFVEIAAPRRSDRVKALAAQLALRLDAD